MAEGAPKPSGGAALGATVQPEYMGRTMKCYPVHETEMESLAAMNTEATAFFSAGSAFGAFAVGIWTNASFADKLTASAEVASQMVAPLLVALALGFFLLGGYTAYRRYGLWKKIKAESVNVPAGPV